MDKTLKHVLLFHEVFGQHISDDIAVKIPNEVRMLRHNLMSEEYLELLKAEGDNNIVEIADALCDLKYVLNGTIISHGLQKHWRELYSAHEKILKSYKEHAMRIDDYIYSPDESFIITLIKLDYFIKCKVEAHGLSDVFEQMFDEVQRSNMSKTCSNVDDALLTAAARSKEFGVQCAYFEKAGRWVVIRVSDKKALKSLKYSKPNLRQFIPESRLA